MKRRSVANENKPKRANGIQKNRKLAVVSVFLWFFLAVTLLSSGFVISNDKFTRKDFIETTNPSVPPSPLAPIRVAPRAAALLKSTPIEIDPSKIGSNWTDYDQVTGTGTYANPFVIENLEINGTGYDNCIAIKNSPKYYFRIQNCVLYNATVHGILVDFAANGTINNNTCMESSGTSGMGITISYSKNITVTGNNCSRNYYIGIYLLYSDNNTVTGNNCSANGYNGINLSYSDNNTVTENTVDENHYYGIYVDHSMDNVLAVNICRENTNIGIQLFYSGRNTITRNFCSGGTNDGIYISSSSSYNNITWNTCADNGYGIGIVSDSCYNLLEGNTCPKNLMYGIYGAADADFNTIIKNNCTGNHSGSYNPVGIWFNECKNNTITKNTCTQNNSYGILLKSSTNTTIAKNNCTGSQFYGIFLSSSTNTTITENNCTGNQQHGICLYSSDNNTITENNCTGNKLRGIYLYQANKNNTLAENTCLKNLAGGIALEAASQSNKVIGNWIKKNVPNTIQDNGTWNIISGNIFINYTVANFIANTTAPVMGQIVQFTSTTTSGGFPISFQWDFGDGGMSVSQDPTHQYTAVGTYTVTLTVTDLDSDSDTETKVAYVTVWTDTVPSVNFTVNATSLVASQWVNFTYTGSGGNSPLTFAWTFGDGGTSTGRNPPHQYAAAGTYTITLTVTDLDSDSDTETKVDYVTVWTDTVPSINFTANPTSVVASQWVTFTYTGSGGNEPLTFSWDFGDGGTSTDRDPTHQYTTAGTYTVTLTVTDGDGDFDTETKKSYLIVTFPPSGDSSDEADPVGTPLIDISTILLIAGVGSIVAISIASLTYHFKKPTRRARKLEQKKANENRTDKSHEEKSEELRSPAKPAKEIVSELSNQGKLLEFFGRDLSANQIAVLAATPLTIVSDDFLAAIDEIDFSGKAKVEFVRELLSFSPSERLQIVRDLLIIPPVVVAVPEREKKEGLEGVLIYEELALDLIQEYLEIHKKFDPSGIISYLNSRFSKAAVNVNTSGIRRILKTLIEKNIVVEGSILARKDVLQNDNRRKILEWVRAYPGIHVNKLVKEMQMPTTVVRWHLNVLEKFSFIRAEKVGNRIAYFDKEKPYQNAEIVHLISQDKCKRIIEYLELHGEGCLLTEISRDLGMHYTTVKKHVGMLEDFDLVFSRQARVYFINEHRLREILVSPAMSPEK